MNKTIKILSLGVALALSATMAKADQVSGVLHFASTPNGDVTYSAGTNPTLTFVNPGSTGLASDNSGSFTGVATGSAVTMTNFTANSVSGVVFTADGVTFTATSDTVVFNSSGFLDITLFGTIGETGFTSSPGTLLFETNGLSGSGTSYAGTITATPEPSSLALLGTGLLGAAGIARRRFFGR